MLSDESSSDSETGRFKESKPAEEQSSKDRESDVRGRGRPSENDKFRRDFGRRREERPVFDKYSRDRHRSSRKSPLSRRHNSRDRSPRRRSTEKHRDNDYKSRSRYHRSSSKEKRNSTFRSHRTPESQLRLQKPSETKVRSQRSPEPRAKIKNSPELKSRNRSPEPRQKKNSPDIRKHSQKSPPPTKGRSFKSPEHKKELNHSLDESKRSPERVSMSPDFKGKRSEIYKPPPQTKRKSDSPIIIEEHESDKSEELQVGSYYKMIPTVVKEKSEEESSEIDSSDDERLRAKLLNLEKELQKTKKKKHKKKHKRKSKSNKEIDEASTSVEVTSTTDIAFKQHNKDSPVLEVSSTQKSVSKESSEEGEISSGDETQEPEEEFDPSDLRHKLKRKPLLKSDICGPALPPHLQQGRQSDALEIEGPALPPHLTKSKNIGPTIPDNMRKVLAEKDCEIIEYESSEDEGIGPVPVGAQSKLNDAHRRLEERALDMKIRSLDGHSMDSQKIKNREEWMLELPEGKTKYLGLEARTFRAKEGPDMSDRSSWTDTPEDKALKAAGIHKGETTEEALQREARSRLINNRDEEQESAVKKHKKKHKRDESLLEQHERKLKKKKKKEEKDNDGKVERRPFSRDLDLQVNRFDEAQKKSIIKKAQGLNTRFSRGEAKYL